MSVVANTVLSIWISWVLVYSAPNLGASMCVDRPAWGFYGHRLINKMAVFSLPPPLNKVFKSNINYIEQQSVAPDKRRYASPIEGIRHYMDMDKYPDVLMSDTLPEQIEMILRHSRIAALNERGDTIKTFSPVDVDRFYAQGKTALLFDIRQNLYELYENGGMMLLTDYLELGQWPSGTVKLYFMDQFSEYGILPYHLLDSQRKMTKGMKDGDWVYVVRLASEMGHYVSDAHVPLHTTSNYNGQMTNQIGIHAFWESRIPELFAELEFDLWVGPAEYIADKEQYFWDIIRTSNQYVGKVLEEEARLRNDKSLTAFCFEERNGIVTRLECEAYSRLYAERLEGMVESRFRAAIRAVASCWYTAWVDAGSPPLESVRLESNEEEPIAPSSSKLRIRTHENE